ncbi:MAG: hypothetical protein JW748_07920 [Anaerolineales bacterium]|nr:hypothetical protein [Anaerolineales bacterium]
MNPFVKFLFLAVLPPAIFSCQPKTGKIESISLDFPHGETRLTVRRDGRARLSYGALPEWLTVESGVFDAGQLAEELRPLLKDMVASEERPIGQPFGMVSCQYRDGGSGEYYLFHGEFAEGLFVTACRNLVAEEEESSVLYEMVCAQRISRTGGSG